MSSQRNYLVLLLLSVLLTEALMRACGHKSKTNTVQKIQSWLICKQPLSLPRIKSSCLIVICNYTIMPVGYVLSYYRNVITLNEGEIPLWGVVAISRLHFITKCNNEVIVAKNWKLENNDLSPNYILYYILRNLCT